ncbi:hypothetical protein BJX64DRAFT_286401 [Aspergillus heterothallicus]
MEPSISAVQKALGHSKILNIVFQWIYADVFGEIRVPRMKGEDEGEREGCEEETGDEEKREDGEGDGGEEEKVADNSPPQDENSEIIEDEQDGIVEEEEEEEREEKEEEADDENEDDSNYIFKDRFSTLLSCSLVNKLWFDHAMPLLWKQTVAGYGDHVPLDKMVSMNDEFKAWLMRISRDNGRREFYANFIETGMTSAWSEGFLGDTLEGLVFPRLKTLFVTVAGGCNLLPRIVAPQLTELVFDPQHYWNPMDEDWISADLIGELFEQIPVLFPTVDKLGLYDEAKIRSRDLQRLKDQLPRLRNIDMFYLTVLDDDTVYQE